MSARAIGAALAWFVVAGCATVAPVPAPAPVNVEVAFDAAGRLSARRGNDGAAVHFTWAHSADADRFDVATPLGQVVARMRGNGAGVRVERPGEAPVAYSDWSALTREVLGVAIPVDGLASWIQGAPTSPAAFDIERDAGGRPVVLRQQGWEIVYTYAEVGAPVRPTRLVMRYPDSEPIEVRVVVDRFAPGNASD